MKKIKTLVTGISSVLEKTSADAKTASNAIKALAIKMHEYKEDLRKDLKTSGVHISKRQLKKGLKRLYSISKANKLGRNDLCPCNSGLKYKRCHLK